MILIHNDNIFVTTEFKDFKLIYSSYKTDNLFLKF